MINIGTAGYSYKDWIGPFYPEGIKDSDMLNFYSLRFNFVELNSTYYHMPGVKLFQAMNKKTPDSFRFAVKLFGGFTHERESSGTEAEFFKKALEPIRENGKMLCLLAQFPYSFHYSSQNIDYLSTIKNWFQDYELMIEFRNQNWIRKETIEFLKKEELGFVCVDEPVIKGLVKKVITRTSNTGYLRMHGRNSEKWYSGQGSERYDYLYSRDELLEWINGIRELESGSSSLIISFNNHPMAKAVENALAIMQILNTK
ncbi:MAG: DUF72 domain-containing protein [Ignavibacteria bacterium]|nr:DUF72 domain-containing protein [Ignavibacteria bacterium]